MSAAIAAAAAAALSNRRSVNRSSSSVENSNRYNYQLYHAHSAPAMNRQPAVGRYESQKRRDWSLFVKYLKNHRHPPLKLSLCSGADVVEFLRYLNQTKIHSTSCPYSDNSQPPPPCSCPPALPGSADALVRRLRVAFEENGGPAATNPFCSSAVRLHLDEIAGVSS